jgi:hypothetical protein
MYEGNYEDGWRNFGGKRIPIVPYHFTAEGSGVQETLNHTTERWSN